MARSAASLAADRRRLAERVGHRRPVDLVGERPERVLVGHVLGGHRHRQVGAPVVGVVEHGDRHPAGVGAGDLDGVLDRLGAGVEQRRPLLVAAGGQLGELLAHVDVAVVRRDHEAGVRERPDLVDDPLDDLGRGVADARDRDAGGQVDQRVAVGVDEDATTGCLDEHGERGADAGSDVLGAPLEQRARARTGDLGHQPPFLGEPRAPGADPSGCLSHAVSVRGVGAGGYGSAADFAAGDDETAGGGGCGRMNSLPSGLDRLGRPARQTVRQDVRRELSTRRGHPRVHGVHRHPGPRRGPGEPGPLPRRGADGRRRQPGPVRRVSATSSPPPSPTSARRRPAPRPRWSATWCSTASPARWGCGRRWLRSTPATRSRWPTRSR